MEFRIPALTYIKFIIENNSNNDFKINLFNIKLKNSSEKVYRLINRNDFSTKFTSVAYSNFRYNKIFSFYTIAFQGVKPKKENYYEKIDPETEITLKPEYTGIQLLPFELISERFLDYILQMPINVEKTVEIPLKYIIYRKDYR
jgi:hypothetical protein